MEKHSSIFEVTDQNFEAQVLQSDLPVILDFRADWCVHCHNLAPVYEKLSTEYAGRLRFAEIDADENLAVPAQLGVMGLPTLVVVAEGQEIGRLVGPHPSRLKQGIDRILASYSEQAPAKR